MKASVLSVVVFLVTCQTVFTSKNCPVLFHGIEGHSACVPRSDKFVSGGVSEADKKIILEEHNRIRAGVSPPACNMLKLYWSDELAYVAQRWAENCEYEYDEDLKRDIPGKLLVAQNLAQGYWTWKGLINSWASQVKDFTWGANNSFKNVGFYIEVVAERNAVIGCGFANCSDEALFVCNYGPGAKSGAKGINEPYAKCDTAAPLIDCKGKYCKNMGTMKKGTCDCECKNWKHIYGPDCSTNCKVKDSSPCGTDWNATDCAEYTNVRLECPWMCNTCPYLEQSKAGVADFKYSSLIVVTMTVLSTGNWMLH